MSKFTGRRRYVIVNFQSGSLILQILRLETSIEVTARLTSRRTRTRIAATGTRAGATRTRKSRGIRRARRTEATSTRAATTNTSDRRIITRVLRAVRKITKDTAQKIGTKARINIAATKMDTVRNTPAAVVPNTMTNTRGTRQFLIFPLSFYTIVYVENFSCSKEKSHTSSKDKHRSSSNYESSKSPEKKEETRHIIKDEIDNSLVSI